MAEPRRKLRAPSELLFERLVCDELLEWQTRGGRQLDGQLILFFAWLADQLGGIEQLPGKLLLRVTDVAARFKRDKGTVSRWIGALEEEGLAAVAERERGRYGSITVRVRDPRAVAQFRISSGSPQATFEFFEREDAADDEPARDVLPLVSEAGKVAPSAGCAQQFPPDGQPIVAPSSGCAQQSVGPSDDGPFVAAGLSCTNTPPALLEALRSHLGADRAEVWLSRVRWQLGETTKCVGANAFELSYLRKMFGRELAAAAAAAGLPPVEFVLAPPPSAECCAQAELRATFTLNKQTFKEEPFLGSSLNKRTNKQTAREEHTRDSGNGDERGSCTRPAAKSSPSQGDVLLAKAEALYARIGDEGLYLWYALAAALELETGALSLERFDELVAQYPRRFYAALAAWRGNRWSGKRGLGQRLKARGIKWRHAWTRNWRDGGRFR